MQRMKLFHGNANPALAASVAAYLGVPTGRARVTTFSDGEIRIRIAMKELHPLQGTLLRPNLATNFIRPSHLTRVGAPPSAAVARKSPNRKSANRKSGTNWLGREDSNLHTRLQRPLSYH